jgi:hypothetical protein
MTSDLFNRFVPAICVGLVLLLLGGSNLLLARRRVWVRVLATCATVGAVTGAVAALEQPGLLSATARLLALCFLPWLVLALRPVPVQLGAAITALHQPRVRFALLTGAGAVITTTALVLFERADEAATDASTAELEALHDRAPTAPNRAVRAPTERLAGLHAPRTAE